ncbi:Fatty acid desaturase [Planctomycetes bacterium Poly30]|uniref:Fatty acid desaturase n=1 Tax=Saltatorellus ferox TaxID=2528018 RepID=A0A518EKP2_9BACT|nr:Fatty acid desaturase [Planctomycetes bacterium Poly30]
MQQTISHFENAAQKGRALRDETKAMIASVKAETRKFQQSHTGKATWQVINSVGSYVALWAIMYFTVQVSWLLTLPFALVAAGVLVRVFIISHDCGHSSFFQSERWNTIIGVITGLLTFTSYHHWRGEHAVHHGTCSNLDRRGTGDVWTMTVSEYKAASRWKKFGYRFVRNPIVLLVIAPLFLFLVLERFPRKNAPRKEVLATRWTNVALAAMVASMCWVFGTSTFLLLQLGIVSVAMGAGVWLFYVQHQFEDTYWAKNADWDFGVAALEGSSFCKLPKILQWFSGNIGFHHIHHLAPRVPNYHLESCHKAIEAVGAKAREVTLWEGIKALRLQLWDEATSQLISFRQARVAYF